MIKSHVLYQLSYRPAVLGKGVWVPNAPARYCQREDREKAGGVRWGKEKDIRPRRACPGGAVVRHMVGFRSVYPCEGDLIPGRWFDHRSTGTSPVGAFGWAVACGGTTTAPPGQARGWRGGLSAKAPNDHHHGFAINHGTGRRTRLPVRT